MDVMTVQVAGRIGRLQAALAALPVSDVSASSPGGEVVVTVDRQGRLLDVQLAADLTAHTSDDLEHVINATLCAAVARVLNPERSRLTS